MNWKVVYTKQAQKDAKKISSSGLKFKAEMLIDILKKNPFQKPPSYEKPKKVLNLIEKCKSVKIPLSNVEKKLIETFQKNNNSFSKTRLIFFSRRNHVDSLKLINELNELFSEKYKEKLILYKANYFYFNHRFLNDSGWK